MSNIATNNGSVVIKNGSVGTDCGCCGGWYCVGPALGMIATVTLTLPGTIYTTRPPSFRISTARITPEYAQAISRQYQLFAAGCRYSWVNQGFTQFSGGGASLPLAEGISVVVEGNCVGDYSVRVESLALWMAADYPNSFDGVLAEGCDSFEDGWANAASATYSTIAGDYPVTYPDGTTRPVPSMYLPTTKQLSLAGCAASANYRLPAPATNGGLGHSLSPGVSATRCVPMLESIDETWTYDIKYIDTAGSSPQEQTLDGALTIRVQAAT